MSRWKVSKSKHDCIGTGKPCSPPCYYLWEVDGPDGELSDVFVTWAEAFEWASKKVRQHD